MSSKRRARLEKAGIPPKDWFDYYILTTLVIVTIGGIAVLVIVLGAVISAR